MFTRRVVEVGGIPATVSCLTSRRQTGAAVEVVGVIVLIVTGVVLLWAALNEAVYRLARTARRGWDDGAPEPQGGSAEPPIPTAKQGT